jgi:di/tricarboxylate transporter
VAEHAHAAHHTSAHLEDIDRVTVSLNGWITLAILVAALAAFAWGRLRADVIALSTVLAVGLTGVATPAAAFAGFGDPTVITIATLFVLSAGLERTGIAYRLARWLMHTVGVREVVLIVTFVVLAGILSSVMYHMAAMAMLLPVALAICRETGLSSSRLLMPLAIGARLGGGLTLIGKPSNLIVSGLLVKAGLAPLSFFAFFPVGIAMLIVGVAFMATYGRRLLPARGTAQSASSGLAWRDLHETYKLPERLFRLRVEMGSALVGATLDEASLGDAFGITVLAIARGRQRIHAPSGREDIRDGDVLLVEARPEALARLDRQGTARVEPEPGADDGFFTEDEAGLAEVVLAPRSELAGKSLRELGFRARYALNVVAIWRDGRSHRTGLADVPLRFGDALLVQGPRERIRDLGQEPDFIPLSEPGVLRTSRMGFALLAAAALVVLGATGIMPLSLAALLAAGIVVIGGCVTADEAFRAVDWPTVIVTGGLLPLGLALQTTGAAGAIAGALISLAGHGKMAALVLVYLGQFALGQIVPAVPATILMGPIAFSTATALGANPVPFMITVAAATSATLLTPLSHPISLMVMGPGGYRFTDYTRVGAPLAALLTATLLGVVTLVWPL